MPALLEEGFDVDRYLRASKKVDLDDLEWDRIKDHPVTVDEARCLAYMMDIESHTVSGLQTVGSNSKTPRVLALRVSMW
jgi:hypothetical protein